MKQTIWNVIRLAKFIEEGNTNGMYYALQYFTFSYLTKLQSLKLI